ncbi:transposase [Candidatus Atribacteria bacterium 1244-E10-H5-B2]|nr:MAG: transposase [Candidatus Atribacteria bacterium 1244-E10-H5-B2]
MKNMDINKLKRPVKYGKIPLIQPNKKGVHMFTGLKYQLEITDTLIDDILPQDNELIKLKKVLNWEKINSIYKECFPSKRGRSTKKTDLSLGLILLKHLYRKPDRALIEELHLNNAYMHFCGLSYREVARCNKQGKKIIDHSTLVKIRQRLGAEKVKKILATFTAELIDKKIIDGKILFTDTTSLEKNIIYPTEIGLLSRVIEEAAAVVQKVRYKKDMVKTKVIKKARSISKVYYSASKKSKKLLKDTSTALLAIAKEQIDAANAAIDETGEAIFAVTLKRYAKLKDTGIKIVDEVEAKLRGEKIAGKIVSYYQNHSRALPKGKLSKPCEFGVKLRLDMSGNGYITNHTLYEGNISDVSMLAGSIDSHAKVFGSKFKSGAADRGFYDGDIIESLEGKYKIALAIPHKKDRNKTMTPHKKKLSNKRSAIEAKISEGKRMCGLDRSLYNGFEGDRIWATLSVMALNIRKLLRDMARSPELMYKFG